LGYVGYEPITVGRDSCDVSIVLPGVAENLPQRGNVTRQVALFDKARVPKLVKKLFLFEQSARILSEYQQEIENLGPKRHAAAVAQQCPVARVDLEVIKSVPETVCRMPVIITVRRFQNISRKFPRIQKISPLDRGYKGT
jgi:hypothetical protein